MKIKLLLGLLLLPFCLSAQLSKPVVTVSNVNWGWFTLNMTGYNQYPQNTRWLIFEGADTVLDPLWGNCGSIQYPFTADRFDLVTKQILGCKPNTQYSAKVSYNSGTLWSPFSDSITFTTPLEPAMQGNDTTFIVLWGHSLIHLGDLCTIKTTIRLGEDDYFLRDNIAHMLQTELKRITNKNIKVINKGQFGSMQYAWFRGDSLNKYYLPGGEFENTGKYKYAMFFFGSNDCNASYPSPLYANDIRWITDFLLSKNVKVIFNSIHHTIALTYANQDSQVVYRNVWNNVMNEYSGNHNVIKGLDFYNLFHDSVRYLWNDGIHCNLSEGMPQVVRLLALLIQDFIGIGKTGEIIPDRYSLFQNYPNPFNPATKIKFAVPQNRNQNPENSHVTLRVYNVLGKEIATLVNENLQPGFYEVKFSSGQIFGTQIPSGVYFYKLVANGYSETKRMVLIK
ncbi:MAG: SGNH/GDSL hydrolase family protein [Ignavibacteria bacterium]|nr:SGNH/GDSL hydrolase family protein [Ignavibacteria bacterium]